MPQLQGVAGAQASAIQFTNLTGSQDRAPVLTGTMTFRPPQVRNEQIEDVHSLVPRYRQIQAPGELRLTMVTDEDGADLSWIRGDVINGASLQVTLTNGAVYTFGGVVLMGEPTEADLTAGTTGELSFGFARASVG
jgi:hypothetical protein